MLTVSVKMLKQIIYLESSLMLLLLTPIKMGWKFY